MPPPSRDPAEASARRYAWWGHDAGGQPAHGVIASAGEASARVALRERGIRPTRLRVLHGLPGGGHARFRRHRASAKEVTAFTRQLATLLDAGIPLASALGVIGQDLAHPALARLVARVRDDIEGGSTLAGAFGRHPRHFDPLYCHMVAAGEHGGMLSPILAQLATHGEQRLALQSRMRGALAYPAAVLAVAGGITLVMLAWVVPAFQAMFADFGGTLPWATQRVMAASRFTVAHWPALLATPVALAAALALTRRRWPRVRGVEDRLRLALPVLGPLWRNALLARWSRTLAALLAAGIPLDEALDIAAGICGNQVYEHATRRLRTAIQGGARISAAMRAAGRFPPMLQQIVAIGEESGTLERMLDKAAHMFERDVDETVAALSSLLEPLIIVVLGLLVGGMVMAMYLPVFKLGEAV